MRTVRNRPTITQWVLTRYANGRRNAIVNRRAEKLLSDGERNDLISYLAFNPLAGDLVVGTGGVRKVRFAAAIKAARKRK